MLYLLRSFGPIKNGKSNYIYKVGYTGNLKKRFDSYQSHNPYIQLIATDIEEFFDIKLCKVPRPGGGRDNGYEILGLK